MRCGSSNIPNLDFAAALGRPTRGREHLSVGAESEGAHIIRMAGERCQGLAAGRIDEPHFLVATHREQLAVRRKLHRGHGGDHGNLRLMSGIGSGASAFEASPGAGPSAPLSTHAFRVAMSAAGKGSAPNGMRG